MPRLVPMSPRRPLSAITVVILLFAASQGALLTVEAASGRAEALDFSGGPSAAQVISGTYTVRTTNVANMSYVNVEAWDGSVWSAIANITGTPWLTAWDTTAHSDGDHKLRIEGTYLNTSTTGWIESPIFSLDNTAPSALVFEVADPIIGDGSSTVNRAWFTTVATGSMTFNWSATDAHLSRATLTQTPGTGTPAQDGPGTLLNNWVWSPGDLPEGTYTPLLSVFDEGDNSAQATLHVGIDRTGPDVGTPSLSESAGAWTDATTLLFSDLSSGATDNGGSGIDTYDARDSTDSWVDQGSSGSGSLSLSEGERTIQFRAHDNVGNIGDALNVSMKVDRSAPTAGGWILPELTDSLTGAVAVEVDATDAHSGIDETSSTLEYGFDSDGTGGVPDITSTWLSVGSGASGSLSAAIDWSTRAGQYLSLRATLVDNATNTVTTSASHFLILPGLDLAISDAHLNRLVVRAGTTDPVTLEATITATEAYTGSVIVRIESAPASRDLMTTWTTLSTVTITAGDLADMTEDISVNLTVLSDGEYDLRVIVDPDDSIAEKDEGNNEEFLLISAANPTVVGAVSGFGPDLVILLLCGLFAGLILRRRESAS